MTGSRTHESPVAQLRGLYRNLSPAARRGVTALLGVELVFIAWAQRDIQRRPAARIRGPKLLWRAIATQNVVGPAAYLGLGRRR